MKKIQFIGFAILMAALACFATAQAAECSRSNDTMFITYSPNDLNVGEDFNLTFYDLFGGAGQQVTLHYPATLTRLSASDTVTLTDDGFGGSYYTWRMNSSSAGNHSVYVTLDYEAEGTCNVTRTITIQGPLHMPNITLSYNITGDITANQDKQASLILENVGVGAAYNVSGWTTFNTVIDTFSHPVIAPGSSAARDFEINTNMCGTSTLESTVNYLDNFGYGYPPSHITASINVVGSDLSLTSFTVDDDKVEKGELVKFEVKVKNVARSSTINASDAIVKIYKGDDVVEEIELDDIEAGDTVTGKGSWRASGSGTIELTAVVDSDNECSNWDNNEKSVEIKVEREDNNDDDGDTGAYLPGAGSSTGNQTQTQQNQTQIQTEKGFSFSELPVAETAIALEALILALLLIYIARRKRR